MVLLFPTILGLNRNARAFTPTVTATSTTFLVVVHRIAPPFGEKLDLRGGSFQPMTRTAKELPVVVRLTTTTLRSSRTLRFTIKDKMRPRLEG